jgi:hypothetical protein
MERDAIRLELLKLPLMTTLSPENKILVAEKLEAYVTRPVVDETTGIKAEASSGRKSKKQPDNLDDL